MEKMATLLLLEWQNELLIYKRKACTSHLLLQKHTDYREQKDATVQNTVIYTQMCKDSMNATGCRKQLQSSTAVACGPDAQAGMKREQKGRGEEQMKRRKLFCINL